MRKLFTFIAILLLASTAFAAEMTQAVSAEFTAQNTGHVVTTDNSVLLQIYYRGTELNPSYGISEDSVVLYDDGAADLTVNTTTAATNTVEEIVAAINADADWVAVAGPDSYSAYAVNGGIIVSNVTYGIGSTLAGAVNIYGDSSSTFNITCGVRADPLAKIRLKNVNQNWAIYRGDITISVYDGDTRVWAKSVSSSSYVSATNNANSSNTVIVAGEKGLATAKNNPLCVVVSTNGRNVDSDPSAKSFTFSIAYDKLRD